MKKLINQETENGPEGLPDPQIRKKFGAKSSVGIADAIKKTFGGTQNEHHA